MTQPWGLPSTVTVAGRPRLESWKEIARHLQVSVRTAQLWEVERALPVHRHPGPKRSRVFSFVDEIEAWLQLGAAELVQEPPEREAAAGQGARRLNRVARA